MTLFFWRKCSFQKITQRFEATVTGNNYRYGLYVLSCLESIIFPIPVDIFLIPLCLKVDLRQTCWIAFLCTLASVVGAAIGYGLGLYAFQTIGEHILRFFNLLEYVPQFEEFYNVYGAWVILFGAITPFPFKVVVIISGLVGYNFYIFLIMCFVGRFIRFMGVAVLINRFGYVAKKFIEKYLGMVSFLVSFFILFGYILYKYLLWEISL